MTIACLDVHYRGDAARAACAVASSWESDAPLATCDAVVDSVQPYEPGAFYRRELPCLLAVLRRLPTLPDVVVIDGYVHLPPDWRPGLGAHLYEAIGLPVVGIAKTAFRGAGSCPAVVPILRGRSRNPLFVTAAGMTPEAAAECVRRMAGTHRIPDLVKLADHLARSGATLRA